MAELTIEGLDAVQRLLAGLAKGPDLNKALQNAALDIAREAQNKLQEYPGPPHSPVLWKNDDQRKAYFASRYNKATKTRLPDQYTRYYDPTSQDLQHSWEAKPWGDRSAIVGTKVSYAPNVQGEAKQQPQHYATGWKTEYDAVENLKSRNVVERIVVAELDSYIKGLKT